MLPTLRLTSVSQLRMRRGTFKPTSPTAQTESFPHGSFLELLCQAGVHPINGPIEQAKVNQSLHILQEVAGALLTPSRAHNHLKAILQSRQTP